MKRTKFKLISLFLLGFFAIGSFFGSNHFVEQTSATEVTNYPRNGQSGTILYVSGQGNHFKAGEADLAIYCYNSESDNAWSERVNYRVFGDILRVMIPYKNGQSKTWSNYIVTRYKPGWDPSISGWDGVINQTFDISFSSMLYAHNTIVLGGYQDGKITHSFMSYNYFGVSSGTYMYLDLSSFTDWETDNAKFALYFGAPSYNNDSAWSCDNSGVAFCWKVQGQDNDHLYECIVPGNNKVWNLVIAVRFNPIQGEPGWYNVYNQTADLKFNTYNHNANMIHISDWNEGYIDSENIISRESRVNFYGQHFLNTVSCSGHGNSDSTTLEMWNNVKSEYQNHLTPVYQGDVWLSSGDPEGSAIEQAMARYDYIVFYKQYSHDDFINRKDSANKTVYSEANHLSSNMNDSNMIFAVISVAIISGFGLTTLLLIKKRKTTSK